ncbi:MULTISPECIES: hypothetical protein [unclassified Croceicoccus]|jgi:hypothetical protein|uniref:hypothetical protein n=1 Tax=unclassified Croceicoccus TaxID=2629967 RepID=UPI001E599B0C|nr:MULTISPECIES: hypothetical protein [unclassified Croceicoccus]
MMSRNLIAALALLPALAACAPSVKQSRPSAPPPVQGVPPQQAQPVPATGFRPARVMQGPGLEGVIGADADGLIRQFGTPRLDVWEGDARKMQFSGTRCTLDVFLYPPRQGAKETATWIDARRSDGQDVDRAACVSAMRQR